ncbi:MerR family transcriptional regulator [Nocardia wallacei]|uniref:MerR family transcriptional regulator n=1 Tax=Nocardia wallacei TaxID=480035 RepID=UPI002453AC5E|nr:MerR family transcriptional regulator [Nocardia wallacei]
MGSRNSPDLRTAAVARRAGYSVQQIRNLERDGVLPPVARTRTGYRIYDESHVRSARAYRALAVGTGPVEAKTIMRAAHTRPIADLLALLDAAHARLDRERRDLAAAKTAARSIAAEPIGDVRSSDAMSITQLADALGVRPSTLRHWDAVGLVVPGRAGHRTRSYTPDDVRDARIVHQLRLAGYRIAHLQALLPELRGTHRGGILAGLEARDASIEARSRALLTAAAELNSVVLQPQRP